MPTGSAKRDPSSGTRTDAICESARKALGTGPPAHAILQRTDRARPRPPSAGRRDVRLRVSEAEEPSTKRRRMLADNPDGKVLSGGHTLLPAMKLRLAGPSALVDLERRSTGLRGIKRKGDSLVIGAAHRATARSRIRRREGRDPGARRDGRHDRRSGRPPSRHDRRLDRQQRSLGRLRGRRARARRDDRDRQPPDRGRRLLPGPLRDGAGGGRDRHRASSSRSRSGWATQKFRNPASRYALCGVCVAETASGEVRVTVVGAGADGVFRATEFEAALKARVLGQGDRGQDGRRRTTWPPTSMPTRNTAPISSASWRAARSRRRSSGCHSGALPARRTLGATQARSAFDLRSLVRSGRPVPGSARRLRDL